MATIHRSPEMVVIHDDRYAPIVITIWSGRANIEAARWHTELQEQDMQKAVAKGQKLISISDATKAERPGPEVRKFWADSLASTTPEQEAGTLSTYVVISSAVMRGVMTAIGWLSERARSIKSEPTLADAIRAALEDLDAAGIPRPAGLDPDGYTPPAESDVT
jgi:hypothetical protein